MFQTTSQLSHNQRSICLRGGVFSSSKLHGQAVDPGVPAVVVAIAQLGRLIFRGRAAKNWEFMKWSENRGLRWEFWVGIRRNRMGFVVDLCGHISSTGWNRWKQMKLKYLDPLCVCLPRNRWSPLILLRKMTEKQWNLRHTVSRITMCSSTSLAAALRSHQHKAGVYGDSSLRPRIMSY